MGQRTPKDAAALHDRMRYRMLAELSHDHDLLPHVRRYLRHRSWITAAYWLASFGGLLAVAWRARLAGIPALDAFSTISLGAVLGYVVLLPVHEHVHALLYRRLGARSVVVRYDRRRLTAYCAADRFVVGARDFVSVCLAPLVAITPPLALAAVAVPGRAGLLLAGAALLHLGACSGDVAFVNFVWTHRGATVLTYDDVGSGRTYFFADAADP